MVHTKDGIYIVERLCAYVREFLDLCGHILDLFVGQGEIELLNTRLDGIPASKSVADGDVPRKTEVFRLENFVGAWVVENCFRVDASFVSEGTVAAMDKVSLQSEEEEDRHT